MLGYHSKNHEEHDRRLGWCGCNCAYVRQLDKLCSLEPNVQMVRRSQSQSNPAAIRSLCTMIGSSLDVSNLH